MTEQTTGDTLAALAKQAAGGADLDENHSSNGNPAPADPPNKPPVKEPTPEEKAAADVAAKAAADKAAAEAKEKADKEAAENAPLNHDVWGTTGSDVGDSVLTLMQNAGMTPDDAKAILFDAFKAGDLTKVDRAALEAKVGKDKAVLILAGTENFLGKSKEKNATIIAEVHKTAGGEANWKAVTAWARTSMQDAELGEYRELIDAGGAKARFAVQELIGKYNADEKNTTLDVAGGLVEGDTKATGAGEAITRAEYVKRLEAAHNAGGNEATIKEIQAARERGRAKGI